MEGLVVAALVGAVLLALWAAATRRHIARRERQRADWEGGTDTGPRLWTSEAACPHCRAAGGVLSTESGEVWFTCLACGQRHRRDTKA